MTCFFPYISTGGTLAHAYFPENGNAHFDEDEIFSVHSTEGVNLFIVAAHEFGHSIGLAHSSEFGALMYPWYQGYVPEFVLPEDDILGVQQLYGGCENFKTSLSENGKG